MTATRSPQEIREIGRDVCRIRSTDQLVESYRLLNQLLDEIGRPDGQWDKEQFSCVVISRGWILDEIETRRSLHLIGICDGCYAVIARCDCAAMILRNDEASRDKAASPFFTSDDYHR